MGDYWLQKFSYHGTPKKNRSWLWKSIYQKGIQKNAQFVTQANENKDMYS